MDNCKIAVHPPILNVRQNLRNVAKIAEGIIRKLLGIFYLQGWV
jgi:hypothetical protein